MNILLFVYNNLLSIIFAVLSFAFFVFYLRTKSKIDFWFSMLFLVYLFDTSAYALTEIFTASGKILNNGILWLTVCSTLFAIVSRWSLRMLVAFALDYAPRKWEYAVYAVHGVAALVCKTMLAVRPDSIVNMIDFSISILFYLVYLSVAVRAAALVRKRRDRIILYAVFAAYTVLVVLAIIYNHFDVWDSPISDRNPFVEGIGVLMAVVAAAYFTVYRKSLSEPSLSEDKLMSMFSDEYGLTAKERELLPMLLSGESNQSISEKSYISTSTVKVHLHNIYQKLGIERRSQVAGQYADFCRRYRK